jgi:CheY-like chemotaxis protein
MKNCTFYTSIFSKDIDGLMATQEIRKLKEYMEIPVVALAAFAGEGDKEEFFAGGCSHFLGKHYTVKQLLGIIKEISI